MPMPWEYPLRLVYGSKFRSFNREKLSSETKPPVASLNVTNVFLHSMKGSQCYYNETQK